MQEKFTNKNESIAVVGAGIGGLTLGMLLRQKGILVHLYEGSDEIKPVGAGIAMASNAMQVYRKAGVAEKIEQAGHRISRMRITDAKLKDLSVSTLTGYERKYGVSNVAIHRGALQTLLADELGREHISLSKRVKHIEVREGLRCFFEDGSTADSDVLIGADGIRSVVRQTLFRGAKVRYSGQQCWRGICQSPFGEKYFHEALEAWGRGKRFGFVRIDAHHVYWYAVCNDDSSLRVDTDLAPLFAEFHPDVLTLIHHTPVNKLFFSGINELFSRGPWHDHNVCLLGDAAHAMTPNMGQGACQAVEDAHVLASLFGTSESVAAAFRTYYRMRRQKVSRIARQSRWVGDIAQIENPLGVRVRDQAMRWLPDRWMTRQLEGAFTIDEF
jgi:2-polyprenyl-6-methoxyphenol hydroxylase-like FAD-dependent oxidoreductase